MKPPPYLLGAGLLLWGWHVDLLPYAVVMGLIIESTRWVPWRWQVTEKDFNRVTDFTSVGFVVVIIYQFDSHAFHAIYACYPWCCSYWLRCSSTAPKKGSD